MRIKTILLIFCALFIFACSQDHAGAGVASREVPITEVVYEVMIPIDLSDQELTDDYVEMLKMLGVLRLEGARQLGLADGPSCHLVVSSCGPNCWYTFCRPGGGSVNCHCSYGLDPATE